VREWASWLLVAGALTAAMVSTRDRLDKAHVALGYLLFVLAVSVRGTRRQAILLALACFVSFNFFFLPPYNTLHIAAPRDWLVLLSFLAVAWVATELIYQARREAVEARKRADEIDRLAALGAEALNAGRAEDALHAIAEVIRSTLRLDACQIFLSTSPGLVLAANAGNAAQHGVPPSARMALERGTVAERPGDVLIPARDANAVNTLAADPEVRALSLSLPFRDRIAGVLRIHRVSGLGLSTSERSFFFAISYYAALGAERVRLIADVERAEALAQADRLKDAVVASVSHDLRTPLTSIKALAREISSSGDDRAVLIEAEADRLNRFVADLLDLSRLNAGTLKADIEENSLDDLLGAAWQQISPALGDRKLEMTIAGDGGLLMARFDFVQTLRVLANLIENGVRYTPPGGAVEVTARAHGTDLILLVEDRGPGVPDSVRELIFEPFYRPEDRPPDTGGAGLGLSIARRLAEIQGGTTEYRPREGGGSTFEVRIPASVVTSSGDPE
jgi:two-component system, OmpR family, sensor histidine kinase KdpD